MKIPAPASGCAEILLLFETDLHVDRLVLRFQRFMDADDPPHAAGKELSGIVPEFFGIVSVVGLTFAQSPGSLHPSRGMRVESYDLQPAHLVEVAFDDIMYVINVGYLFS